MVVPGFHHYELSFWRGLTEPLTTATSVGWRHGWKKFIPKRDYRKVALQVVNERHWRKRHK
jgi:hypothetical protein